MGTSELSAEQLVVLCYWLAVYAHTFLIGCRFWACFSIRVDAGMAFWRLAVRARRSVCRRVVASGGDVVGHGDDGVLRHLSGLLQVTSAQVRRSYLGTQVTPSFLSVFPQLFAVNTGKMFG